MLTTETGPDKSAAINAASPAGQTGFLNQPDTLRYPNAVYRTLCGPMVLMFLTAGKPVYIGWSKAGLGFCTGQGKYPVKHCEEVLVFPCESYDAARELHAMLVEQHHPRYNANAQRFSERAVKRLAEHFRG